MNNIQIRAFVSALKKQKNERNNKTSEQLRYDDIQRTDFRKSPNGNRSSVYRTISKWIWG